MAMTVASVVRVSFEDQSRRAIFLPPDLIWRDIQAHHLYVKLDKGRSEIFEAVHVHCFHKSPEERSARKTNPFPLP